MRRRLLVIGLVALLVAAVGAGGLWWWSRPRVLEAGSVVVLVEGRHLDLNGSDYAGFGIGGTLALMGGRCLGMESGDESYVIVWPPGTSVSGSGESLTVTAHGRTLRLGDTVQGGTLDHSDFPEFDGRLPAACVEFKQIDFDPTS
jgi:hypothetical protein